MEFGQDEHRLVDPWSDGFIELNFGFDGRLNVLFLEVHAKGGNH